MKAPPPGKGGKDKGKEIKKPIAKKDANADDKNAPKNIEIDYPPIDSENNFLILEKSYK